MLNTVFGFAVLTQYFNTIMQHSISTNFSTVVFAYTVKNTALFNTAFTRGLLVLTLVGFDMKGGDQTFRPPKLGLVLRCRKSAKGLFYRMLRVARMSSIKRETKTVKTGFDF